MQKLQEARGKAWPAHCYHDGAAFSPLLCRRCSIGQCATRGSLPPNTPSPPRPGTVGTPVSGLSCLSWRVGVEAHNIIDWETVPEVCGNYVGNYMLGDQYRKDSRVVADEAVSYAQSLKLVGDGRDIWVFDIDETTLSNLPYYAKHGFGVEPYNSTLFNKWVLKGKAPALPETLKLYKKLLAFGFKIAFVTGRTEDQRNVTVKNLRDVGFHAWEKLLLKGSVHKSTTTIAYKSDQRQKLASQGYRIIGNIGDQWTDILGTHVGNRTFKLPDPCITLVEGVNP
ncbi:Acid phosphatase [Bertholletia excelsa]